MNDIFIKQTKTDIHLTNKEENVRESYSNKNIIIETTSNIKYERIKKDINKCLLIEKINNFCFQKVNKYNIKNKNNLIIDSILNLKYNDKENLYNNKNVIMEKIENLEIKCYNDNKFKNLVLEKSFNIFYEKTITNKNIINNIDKIQYFSIEAIKKCFNNYDLENTINLFFEGIKNERQRIENSKLKEFKLFEKIKNNNIYIDGLKKYDINKNYIIEKINNIIYEKNLQQKTKPQYEIKTETYFSILINKKFSIKIFQKIEISKDILSNIFIKNSTKKEEVKKEISNTSINAKLNNNIMNNINTNVNNNIRNVSTFNNKINNSNNDKLNKKILRTSRAMNRIKKIIKMKMIIK